jgi:hypothetical protein
MSVIDNGYFSSFNFELVVQMIVIMSTMPMNQGHLAPSKQLSPIWLPRVKGTHGRKHKPTSDE